MLNSLFSELASITFELTLFGIFVYYVLYVVIQFVAQPLRSGLEESITHMNDLAESKDKAIATREESEMALRTQHQTLDEFEYKMKQWFEKIKEEEHELKKNQQLLNARLREKRTQQSAYLQRKIELSTLLPQMLETSEAALRKRLAGSEGASVLQSYIDQLGTELSSGKPS